MASCGCNHPLDDAGGDISVPVILGIEVAVFAKFDQSCS